MKPVEQKPIRLSGGGPIMENSFPYLTQPGGESHVPSQPPAPGEPETSLIPLFRDAQVWADRLYAQADGDPETDSAEVGGLLLRLAAALQWATRDSTAPVPAGARPSGMEGDALDLPITADEERQGFSSLPHVVMGMLDNWLDDFTDDTPPEVWQRIEFAERVVRRVHAASLASRPAPGADLAGMLDGRITAYLAGGGLWNPELANHDAVRDLLIDARAAFAQVAREREEAVDRGNRWKDLGQAADSERITAEIAQRAAESALATAQAETAALRGVVEERIVDLTFEKQRHGVTCDCRTQFSCDDATTFLSKKIAGFRALLARPATEEGT